MKLILKNGKEYDASAISFNYGALDKGSNQQGTYNVMIPIASKPVEQVDDIIANFTVDNISKITAVSINDRDEEVVDEFEFSEVININLSIADRNKGITIVLK